MVIHPVGELNHRSLSCDNSMHIWNALLSAFVMLIQYFSPNNCLKRVYIIPFRNGFVLVSIIEKSSQ